jgi:hypothetical protein
MVFNLPVFYCRLVEFCGGKEAIPTSYGSFTKIIAPFGNPRSTFATPTMIPPGNVVNEEENMEVPVLSSLGYPTPSNEALVKGKGRSYPSFISMVG